MPDGFGVWAFFVDVVLLRPMLYGKSAVSIAGSNCKPLLSNFNNYRDINSSFSPLGHSYNRFS